MSDLPDIMRPSLYTDEMILMKNLLELSHLLKNIGASAERIALRMKEKNDVRNNPAATCHKHIDPTVPPV